MKKNIIKNKNIKYNYKIIQKYIVGIVLKAIEVKLIKLKLINILKSYCVIKNLEMYLYNCYFINHKFTNYKYKFKRFIKLLLNKKEIIKINKLVKQFNYLILPYKIFLNNNNKIKIIICICKYLNKKDIRNSIRLKDLNKNYLD
ncbi:MAG: SsrA-binding protein [Candidatus Shikimatogenerans sp. AspAUS03]|uniref:SsrA-binding protein n=1 Tax=Candidatus Shikimatogenerans sp. AspAUS03 TaxID=3158563 RepID=A0AAU7QSY9_9FLAO